MNGEQAQQFLEAHQIETVECCFADLWGVLSGRRVPAEVFPAMAERGTSMPNAIFAWNVQGDILPMPYASPDTGYPNMHLMPDLATLRTVPWEEGTALCLMDAYVDPGGSPHPLDARSILRSAVTSLSDAGYRAHVASELEFYLCTDQWEPIYADHRPWSMANAGRFEAVIGEMRRYMLGLGIPVESSQTEYGPGQMEINVSPSDPVTTGDNATLLRYVVKLVARRHGLRATFMPVPFQDQSGSGHHLHLSLFDAEGERNTFDSGEGSVPDEKMAHFLAGVLARLPELSAVNLPSINAYKRVFDYSFAPNRICWGLDNRTAAIRVPPARGSDTRLEIRAASADANPYLVIAGTAAAGLAGLENGETPPPPLEGDAYKRNDLELLPSTLEEASRTFSESAFCRETFGDVMVDVLSHLERYEVDQFRRHVTDWERDRYLDPC